MSVTPDIFSNVRGKKILPPRKQEEKGVPLGEDHDGDGAGLPDPQHPPHHPGGDGGVSAKKCGALL